LRPLRRNYHSTLLWLWLWSCRRCDAFTPRLLLPSHHRTLSCYCTCRTFHPLLLALHISYAALWWCNGTRLFRHSRRLLLNTTLLFHRTWLFHWSLLLRGRLLLYRRLLGSLLRWATAALPLITHLELLFPRTFRRRVHAHGPG
jgi:hypothetical protein